MTIAGISIGDVDAASGNLEVTLAVADGTFDLSQTTGLTFSIGDGAADTDMTFQGTLTDINAALNNLVYRDTDGFNGAESLSVNVNNLGNSGIGVAQSAADTVSIEVGPVNDALVITVPGAQVADRSSTLTIGGISVSNTDVGADPPAPPRSRSLARVPPAFTRRTGTGRRRAR